MSVHEKRNLINDIEKKPLNGIWNLQLKVFANRNCWSGGNPMSNIYTWVNGSCQEGTYSTTLQGSTMNGLTNDSTEEISPSIMFIPCNLGVTCFRLEFSLKSIAKLNIAN